MLKSSAVLWTVATLAALPGCRKEGPTTPPSAGMGTSAGPAAAVAASAAPTAPQAVAKAEDPSFPSAETRAMRQELEALGEKRVYSPQVEARLVAGLSHGDQDVRGHACWGLGRMAPQTRAAIPALVLAMADPAWAVQHNAAWALVQFGELARPALVAALSDPSLARRVRAAVTLAGQGTTDQQVEAVLVAGWATASPDVRVAILQGLGALKPPSAAAVSLAGQALEGPLSMAALDSLAAMGPAAAATAPALVKLGQSSKDKDLLRKIPLALGAVGVASPEVLTLLQAMLDSGDEHLCAAASGALSQLEAIEALASSLQSPSKRVRISAVQGLAAVAALSDRRLALVLSAFGDREWEVRLAAVAAFHGRQELLAAKAIPSLTKALKDEHEAVRGHAKATLDLLKAAIAQDGLRKVLQ